MYNGLSQVYFIKQEGRIHKYTKGQWIRKYSEFYTKKMFISTYVYLQLLRSSLVNNKTQSLVSEELGMVDYVIHADHPSDIREPQPSLRMKHKADLLECKYKYADKPPCE